MFCNRLFLFSFKLFWFIRGYLRETSVSFNRMSGRGISRNCEFNRENDHKTHTF